MRSIAILLSGLALGGSSQVLVGGRELHQAAPDPGTAQRMTCDTTLLFYTGFMPQGLAVVNEVYWVMYTGSPYLIGYDENGVALDSIDIGQPGDNYGGLYHENGMLWLMREQTATLHRFEMASGIMVEQFQLPMISLDPNYWGVERMGSDLIVSFYANGLGGTTLYKVDPTNGTVLDSVFVGGGLWLMELQVIGGELYGIDVHGQTIYKVDPATGTILSAAPWCLPYAVGADMSLVHGMVGTEGFVPAVFVVDSTTVTGTVESWAQRISMHPNPAQGEITINVQGDGACQVALSAMDGRPIRRWNAVTGERTVDLRGIPPGTYAITFDGDRRVTGRLVITR